jgi:hypothetical protein
VLKEREGYYEFYHKNTGYAFFVYATQGNVGAITAPTPSRGTVSKIVDWSGSNYSEFQTQINKTVTPKLLSNKSEVEKLRVVLKHKISVPRYQ